MEIEPLHDVDLCSTAGWKDFKGGIYFEDGALTQDERMPPVIKLDIQQCFLGRVFQFDAGFRV